MITERNHCSCDWNGKWHTVYEYLFDDTQLQPVTYKKRYSLLNTNSKV